MIRVRAKLCRKVDLVGQISGSLTFTFSSFGGFYSVQSVFFLGGVVKYIIWFLNVKHLIDEGLTAADGLCE